MNSKPEMKPKPETTKECPETVKSVHCADQSRNSSILSSRSIDDGSKFFTAEATKIPKSAPAQGLVKDV